MPVVVPSAGERARGRKVVKAVDKAKATCML